MDFNEEYLFQKYLLFIHPQSENSIRIAKWILDNIKLMSIKYISVDDYVMKYIVADSKNTIKIYNVPTLLVFGKQYFYKIEGYNEISKYLFSIHSLLVKYKIEETQKRESMLLFGTTELNFEDSNSVVPLNTLPIHVPETVKQEEPEIKKEEPSKLDLLKEHVKQQEKEKEEFEKKIIERNKK